MIKEGIKFFNFLLNSTFLNTKIIIIKKGRSSENELANVTNSVLRNRMKNFEGILKFNQYRKLLNLS